MAIPSKSGRMWIKLAPSADLPNHTHWEWDLRGWFSLTSRSEHQCRGAGSCSVHVWQVQEVNWIHQPLAPGYGWGRVGKLQPCWAPWRRRGDAFPAAFGHPGLARWLLHSVLLMALCPSYLTQDSMGCFRLWLNGPSWLSCPRSAEPQLQGGGLLLAHQQDEVKHSHISLFH